MDRERKTLVIGLAASALLSVVLAPALMRAAPAPTGGSAPRGPLGDLHRYDGAPTDGRGAWPTPRGTRVKTENLPRIHGEAFTREVFRLLQAEGLEDEPAALVTGLPVLETGGGESCRCNNVGNIRARATWTGPWYRLGNGSPWRAYPSLRAGVRALLGVLRGTRYREAWEQLEAGDEGWYRTLIAAGYAEEDPDELAATYRGVMVTVRRRVL